MILKRLFHQTQSIMVSKNATITESIIGKLNKKFGYTLVHAEVKNHSWKENKPKDAETNLEVVVVSTEFDAVKMNKRIDLVKDLLKEEIKKVEKIDFKCLSPTNWYDSNQRGLKLKEIFADPPLPKPEELEKIAKTFYSK